MIEKIMPVLQVSVAPALIQPSAKPKRDIERLYRLVDQVWPQGPLHKLTAQ